MAIDSLSNVLPSLTVNGGTNDMCGNIILFGKVFDAGAFGVKASHFFYFRISQFCETVILSPFSAHKSALTNRITSIVPTCSKEHMKWVTAGRIVAFVTHAKSLWNRTVCNKPTHTVGFSLRTRETAISFPVRSSPRPAIKLSRDINEFPKSNLRWDFPFHPRSFNFL